jgi:NuA3 HAT complex component NTO1
VQVEYDMDEQGESKSRGIAVAERSIDQAWLDAINAERVKEQSGPIPYEVFEIIIDKLEKEWFELVSRNDQCQPDRS